jgi:hypothetical protein
LTATAGVVLLWNIAGIAYLLDTAARGAFFVATVVVGIAVVAAASIALAQPTSAQVVPSFLRRFVPLASPGFFRRRPITPFFAGVQIAVGLAIAAGSAAALLL